MSLSISPEHIPGVRTRRDILRQAGAGFGAMALEWLLARDGSARTARESARAQAAAFRSQGEIRHLPVHGRRAELTSTCTIPSRRWRNSTASRCRPATARWSASSPSGDTPLMKSPFEFKQLRQCGMPVSTLMPHTAEVRGRYLLRALVLHRKRGARARPCTRCTPAASWRDIRAWARGSPTGWAAQSENLPAYAVMPQPEGTPEGGTPCWGAGFLPAVYQGTLFRPGPNPILNLKPPAGMTAAAAARHARSAAADERARHRPIGQRNGGAHQHLRTRVSNAVVGAGGRGSLEGDASHAAMYGLDQKRTADFGTRCLLARRMVERGVRFVQIYSGRRSGLHAVGRAHAPGGEPRKDVRHDGPADRRAAARSEAARPARFHAGRSGAASSDACR